MSQIIEKREMLWDRREKVQTISTERRSVCDRRSLEGSIDVSCASTVINRIAQESKKAATGRFLAGYLIRNDLVGVLWSPRHLACVFYHLEHHTGIRQSVDGVSRLFTVLAKALLKDYKTLSFAELQCETRAELQSALDAKIAALYGANFMEHVKVHGITPDADICQHVEAQWNWKKTTSRGPEISL